MPEATYTRSDTDYPRLPRLGFPDWELVEHIADLFRPYGTEAFAITASDKRGDHSADNVEDLQIEQERRHVPLDSLAVEAWRVDPNPLRAALRMRAEWSMYNFTGTDEASVELLYQRTRDIFDRASQRHRAGEAERQAAAARDAEEAKRAAQEASWWHNPNPWVISVVSALIGVAGGLAIALIFR